MPLGGRGGIVTNGRHGEIVILSDLLISLAEPGKKTFRTADCVCVLRQEIS